METQPQVIEMDPLEKRLICAQMLNGILKQEQIIKWKPKNDEIAAEIEGFVKAQLSNLYRKVMGERTNEEFTAEEVQILKSMVSKIRTSQGVKT